MRTSRIPLARDMATGEMKSEHSQLKSPDMSSSSPLPSESDSVQQYFANQLAFVAKMKSSEETASTRTDAADKLLVRIGETYGPEEYYIEYLRNKLGLVQSLADTLSGANAQYKARLELADKAINELQLKSIDEKANTVKWLKVAEESKEEMLELLTKSGDKLKEAIVLGESVVDQSPP